MTQAFMNLAEEIERVVAPPLDEPTDGTAGCHLTWPQWQMVLDALRGYTSRTEADAPADAGWMFAGRAEDLPPGPPAAPGTKLYAFDARGTWTYNLPVLP